MGAQHTCLGAPLVSGALHPRDRHISGSQEGLVGALAPSHPLPSTRNCKTEHGPLVEAHDKVRAGTSQVSSPSWCPVTRQGCPQSRGVPASVQRQKGGSGKKECSLTSAAGKPMPLRELSRYLSLSFSSSISFSSHFCGS